VNQFQTGDGATLHYEVIGSGRPVVLLHGWTSSHREWLYYATQLSGSGRFLCWDARGHGFRKQPADAEPPTVGRMAEDLFELIRHEQLQAPVLLGHSMGALTAWEHIGRYGTDHLGGLVLIDQSPRLVTDQDWDLGIYGAFDADHNTRFIEALETDFAEAVLRLAAYGYNTKVRERYEADSGGFRMLREFLREMDAGPLIECWRSLAAADYRAVLPKIDVPTLLIYGDQSQFYSLEVAEFVRSAIPNAQLEVYRNSDHSPHLWQRDRFLADMKRFLADLDRVSCPTSK